LTKKQYNRAVEAYSGQIYRYALRFLKDAAFADDMVQDVFLKLWQNRNSVDPDKVRAWLFATAHNRLINFTKRESRQEPLAEKHPERGQNDDHRFEWQDLLDHCLDRLPPLQKSILLLRDLEGYNYKEIGEMLELSDSQVKVYLFRARKAMKEQLKGIKELQ
jgi:RNA polymerase sigma-70 factor (ECF subfamily)